MDLYPTPTRVRLLRDVEAKPGNVYRIREPAGYTESYCRDPHRKVTAMCEQLERADWIRLGLPARPSMFASRPWELTDKGREILAGAS